MASKQPRTQSSAAGAALARVSKSRTTRVGTSKHSKAVPAEEATVMVKEEPNHAVEEILASLTHSPESQHNPIEIISKLAYGYWEERGGVGGNPVEDWARAEEEYRKQLASR